MRLPLILSIFQLFVLIKSLDLSEKDDFDDLKLSNQTHVEEYESENPVETVQNCTKKVQNTVGIVSAQNDDRFIEGLNIAIDESIDNESKDDCGSTTHETTTEGISLIRKILDAAMKDLPMKITEARHESKENHKSVQNRVVAGILAFLALSTMFICLAVTLTCYCGDFATSVPYRRFETNGSNRRNLNSERNPFPSEDVEKAGSEKSDEAVKTIEMVAHEKTKAEEGEKGVANA